MTRKLPFDCEVLDYPETVQNPFSGESIELSPDAVAVYEVIMGNLMLAEQVSDFKKKEHFNKTVRKGLTWFRQHEPKAYMVLLD
jgi:hypothetical protein